MKAPSRLTLAMAIIVAGIAAGVATSGCATTSPAIDYYALGSLEGGMLDGSPPERPELALGIGPIEVPEYLNKSQIVTRQGDQSYSFNEFHRWASRLEKDIASVVGNNLGILLGTDKIGFFPWMSYFKPTYRVIIEVIQFDSALDGDAVLSVRWVVTDPTGKNALASGKSTYREALVEPTYRALVKAESQLLEKLSRELADEVKRLLRAPTTG